jgi:hypothetical protein
MLSRVKQIPYYLLVKKIVIKLKLNVLGRIFSLFE